MSVDAQPGCGGVAAPVEVALGQVAVTRQAAATFICRSNKQYESGRTVIPRCRCPGVELVGWLSALAKRYTVST